VPAAIHVDPGSGYLNRMIAQGAEAFCARMGIEVMATLPGNAKGKGLVERWFGIFEERVGKKFASYCGHCRTDDALRRLRTRIARGELELPSIGQYLDAVRGGIERLNTTPSGALDERAPAQVWAALERTPVVDAAALERPVEARTVRRGGIWHWNRLYRHPALAAYEGAQVHVQYDLHDDRAVAVRSLADRYICDAARVEKRPWLPRARVEELGLRRVEGQRRRVQRHLDEIDRRAALTVSHERDLRFLDVPPAAAHLETGGSIEPPAAKPVSPGSPSGIELDLDDTDYL